MMPEDAPQGSTARTVVVVDIGNSECTVARWTGARLSGRWRISTDATRSIETWTVQLQTWLRVADPRGVEGPDADDQPSIAGVAIGSVVPQATPAVVAACRAVTGVDPVLMDARQRLPLRIEVDAPLRVGADRLLNTLAAHLLYRADAICIDLGTATTFDCVTADGRFLGGAIMPGIFTAADALTQRAAQLPPFAWEPPPQVIGTNTQACLQSGIVFGAIDAIDGMVRRLKDAWPTASEPRVIATGGLATSVASLCTTIDAVEPDLTLQGLRLAWYALRP